MSTEHIETLASKWKRSKNQLIDRDMVLKEVVSR